MIKFLSSLAVILLFSSGVLAQDWAWKPFSPTGKSWTILAPGEMKPDEEALEPRSKMGSYRYSDFYGFFAVVYRDASKGFLISLPPDQKRHFKKVKNDFIVASKGQLLKEADFEYGRMNGRELLIKIPSGTMTGVEGQVIQKYRVERIRMFFIGRRFYMLLAVLPEDMVNTPTVDKFFDSFSFNSAPEAIADAYSTDEDATLRIEASRGVLANDRDEDDDRLSVAAARAETLPANGSLTLNADGSFNYTPKENFFGQDSFSYKANDGQVDSQVVTVAITVNSVNDAPTISNLPPAATLDELTQMSFAPLANDIDTPASALRFTLIDAPAGAAIDAVSGAFRWTPTEAQGPANYTFRVSVFDGSASAVGTVNVTINEVNVVPQLSNIPPAAINELSAYTFAANGSDADLPANTLTYSLIGAPPGASINPSTGAFSWTPSEAQGNGSTYGFTVRLSDGTASVDVPVRLTAQEVNSAPVLASIANQTVDEETALNFTASAGDTDLPANSLVYSLVNAPAGASINASTGAFKWTPTEAQGAGSFNVTIRVTDNGAPSLSAEQSVTITVREVNKPPTAIDAEINGIEDKAVSFVLRASDADLPANALSFWTDTALLNGTLTRDGANITYTPNPNFNGTESFTFKANDGAADSQTAKITIKVAPVNDAPVANADSTATTVNTPVDIMVTGNDRDIDGDNLTVSSVSDAVGGTAQIESGGNVRFTPNKDFRGTGSFRYTLSDGKGGTATGSVTVTVGAP